MAKSALLFFILILVTVQTVWADGAKCKIVFAPGAFGHGTSSRFLNEEEYFADYEKFFRAKGCATVIAQLQVNGTVELHARMLRDQIADLLRKEGGGQVVIIAHSQGALDARFAINALGLQNVSALIMIGAPNRGTPLAQWVIDHRSSGSLLYWIVRLVGRYDLRALYFVGEMTETFLNQHASVFTAVPGVKYASARGVCQTHCAWPLRVLDWISGFGGLGSVEGGDGIIPAGDQAFGDDLGDYDLDHISEISQDPVKSSERMRLLNRISQYLDLPAR